MKYLQLTPKTPLNTPKWVKKGAFISKERTLLSPLLGPKFLRERTAKPPFFRTPPYAPYAQGGGSLGGLK